MGFQRVVQGCFMGISRVFYRYFFYDSGMFACVKWLIVECFKSVPSVQVISLDIFWVFKGVLMLFYRCVFSVF